MSAPEDENFRPATMTENTIYVGNRKYVAADLPPTLSAALAVPEVSALVEALREARSDLAAYVEADWPEPTRSQYPPLQAKWKRDMELCWRIDAALAALDAAKP